MKTVIRRGRIVDPAQGLDEVADLLIEDGTIAAIGPAGDVQGADLVEAEGWIVAPGFIDMHVHLREPGQEDKETIETGVRAAVAGGFTSVMCMANTDPVNDNETVTRYILERARQANLANVFPAGAVTKGLQGQQLAEIGEMVRAGIVAISDDGLPIMNNQIMRRALEYSSMFDIPVIDHSEDRDLAAGGCMNEGSVSTRLGLPAMSSAAEEVHVVRDIILSRITGGRSHIAHISSRESLNQVRRGKEEGVAVTCEVTPHHIVLSDSDIRDYDTNYKMHPPLRTERDKEAMLEGLVDGTIDCIATDHAPHTEIDKQTTFDQASPGIVGLETAIPLCWQALVETERISVTRFVELFSTNPSRLLRLDRGSLRQGSVADVTLIDPQAEFTVDVDLFRSKGRNAPFHDWTLKGLPVMTIVNGRQVYRRPASTAG